MALVTLRVGQQDYPVSVLQGHDDGFCKHYIYKITTNSPHSEVWVSEPAYLLITVNDVDILRHGYISTQSIGADQHGQWRVTCELAAPVLQTSQQKCCRVFPPQTRGDFYDALLNAIQWRSYAELADRDVPLTVYRQSYFEVLERDLAMQDCFSYYDQFLDHTQWCIYTEFRDCAEHTLKVQRESGLVNPDTHIHHVERVIENTITLHCRSRWAEAKVGDIITIDQHTHERYRIHQCDHHLDNTGYWNQLLCKSVDEKPRYTMPPHHFLGFHLAQQAENQRVIYFFDDTHTPSPTCYPLQPSPQLSNTFLHCPNQVGATVLVGYLHGDLQQPLILGALNRPSVVTRKNRFQQRLQTASKQQIIFNEKPANAGITIKHSFGHAMTLHQKGKIDFNSLNNYTVTVNENIDIECGADWTINSKHLRVTANQDFHWRGENAMRFAIAKQVKFSATHDIRHFAKDAITFKSKQQTTLSAKKALNFLAKPGRITFTAKAYHWDIQQTAHWYSHREPLMLAVKKNQCRISTDGIELNSESINFHADEIIIHRAAGLNS